MVRHRVLTEKDKVVLLRQLSLLLNNNVSLVEALEIVEDSFDSSADTIVKKLRTDVVAGMSLADALEKQPRHFEQGMVEILRAGEKTGKLPNLLSQLSQNEDRIASALEEIKRKVKEKLAYPMAILVILIVITSIVCIFILPQLQAFFTSAGAELPLFSATLLRVFSALMKHGIWIVGSGLLAIVLVVFGFRYLTRFRRSVWNIALNAPVTGKIMRLIEQARFAQRVSIMLSADESLVRALETASRSVMTDRFEREIERIRDSLGAGKTLHGAMVGQKIFDRQAIQEIRIGERVNRLANTLTSLGCIYEVELKHTATLVANESEALTYAILGIIVGSLVISLYLPIFQLGQAV